MFELRKSLEKYYIYKTKNKWGFKISPPLKSDPWESVHSVVIDVYVILYGLGPFTNYVDKILPLPPSFFKFTT